METKGGLYTPSPCSGIRTETGARVRDDGLALVRLLDTQRAFVEIHILLHISVRGFPGVEEVVGPPLPRAHVAGHGHHRTPLACIGGFDIEVGLGLHCSPARRDSGNRAGESSSLHGFQHAAEQDGRGVGSQRPRGVGVAEHERTVGHVLHPGVPPQDLVGQRDGLAVDEKPGSARDAQSEPGCGHDDVGLDRIARVQFYRVPMDVLDAAGDHACPACADRAVKVSVGSEAEALVPGVVGRLEVLVDRVLVSQRLDRLGPEDPACRSREPLAIGVHEDGHEDEVETHDLEHQRSGEEPIQPGVSRVGQWHDVCRAPLHHGDVLRLVRQTGQEGNGRGAATHDGNLFSFVVQVRGPELRVDDLAREILQGWDLGLERPVVVVVATPYDQCRCLQVNRLLSVRHHRQGPDLLVRGPACGDDLVVKANVLINPFISHAFPKVVEYRSAVGDQSFLVPRPPWKAKVV